MRVAHFTDSYLPHNNGVAKAIWRLHRQEKDWESEVFAPVRHEDVKFIGNIPSPFTPEYKFALSKRRIVEDNYDLIHAHTPYPMFYYAWKEAREKRLPLIGTFHTDPSAFFGDYVSTDSRVGRFASKVMWKYLMRLYENCDLVISPSKKTEEELLSRGLKAPLETVPNGIDLKIFNPKTPHKAFLEEFSLDSDLPIVLFLGRLEKRKRPDSFVRAATASKADAQFIVAGEGKMLDYLKTLSKGDKRIKFVGRLDDRMLKMAFAAADLFVLSSESETQGLVLLEAMASGCAAVSTDVGAASELLDKGDIFDVGDYRTLSSRIDEILGDERLLKKKKRENRKKAEKGYSLEKMAKMLKEAYGRSLASLKDTKVTVIVPSLNEIGNIEACLESIRRQSHKNFEIIVADGHSKDGTDKLAKEYGKVVYCKKRGPGAARNSAAKIAKGEIVAFTDADTIVPTDWLEKIVYEFKKDPELSGLGGVLRPYGGNLKDEIMFKINSDLFYRFSSRLGFQQLATPNCAYRKRDFEELGGFDESLSMFEDTDLSRRMSRVKKLGISKEIHTLNSVRRMDQEKYSLMFLKYLKVHLKHLLGRNIGERHFETIDH